MLDQTIGFVGAGQMAQALARGLVQGGVTIAPRIVAHDPHEAARRQFLAELPGARCLDSNRDVATAADVVILAVKPQQLDAVLADLRPGVTEKTLWISIVAGATIDRLTRGLGAKRVVRVMPNTPCLVGSGASAYAYGPGVVPGDGMIVDEILSASGISLAVKEAWLDAVTGLSGSGPAFVYLVIEALADGGVLMGLSRSDALLLAAQTVRGAAEMVLKTGEHPAVLKDRVASPGGTTIAGLQRLETSAIRGALIAAVEAATNRSRELGQS